MDHGINATQVLPVIWAGCPITALVAGISGR